MQLMYMGTLATALQPGQQLLNQLHVRRSEADSVQGYLGVAVDRC